MDVEKMSDLLGEYFAHVARRNSSHATQAIVHGVAPTSKNPFTGQSQSYRVPKSFLELSVPIKKHGLDKDAVFVGALTKAISDVTQEPIAYILSELGVLQEHGDGGPDPSFELRLDHETPANMKTVIKAFEKAR